ncbi:MAG TPA: nickel pincer cofactor biosynthesis protein LarC [Acidimicrobiales bacterium]|nr:nickel pincer cofactor biosynthesis protein LarC [Acidimicrobiales bacterium]
MKRAAWFNCFSGVAGDMVLGSLIDAGADLETINTMLAGLGDAGPFVSVRKVLRSNLTATKIEIAECSDVRVRGSHGAASPEQHQQQQQQQQHQQQQQQASARPYRDIVARIQSGGLPERVTRRSLAIFDSLAQAESRIHGIDPDDVHFHEIGGIDCLGDIVGTAIALELLAIDEIFVGPITVGTGTIQSAHGILPNPSPATVELLKGFEVKGSDLAFELATPTGAAIFATLSSSSSPLPAMSIETTGYGAGSRELDRMPNCTQVVIGELVGGSETGTELGQPLDILETNLDDTTGEVLAYTMDRLFQAGAEDVWITPTSGKKGRPAYTLSVMCDPSASPRLSSIIIHETGTLGVRHHRISRQAVSRSTNTVDVLGNTVRLKNSQSTSKAEFEDLRAIALESGRPLREIAWLAMNAPQDPGSTPQT